jgi:hypothetical protein
VNVDDHAAHRGRQIVGRPDGILAIEKRLGIAQGIWVNEHLVRVEPKSFAVEILWPIDTIGVMSAGLKAPDIDVPEKESLVVVRFELDDLDWLDVVLPLKEKQLDRRGIPGEDREIYSLLIDSST